MPTAKASYMEFTLSLLFLILYYVRPQDWVPGLAGANVIKPVMAVWLFALVANRSQRSPFPGFLKTPHDWIMVGYMSYVVWTAPDWSGTFKAFLPLVAFYALTVQSVNQWGRLLTYLKWWNGCLVAVALLAVLSLHGIDLTGAREVTEVNMGRLAINTYLHNNPNSLAHSIIVIIPLSFVLYFWRGRPMGRLFVFPALFALAFYCAWKTESKGAFVVGGLLVTLIFVIGRPKIVQIAAIVIALTAGVSALSFLPRMSDMGNLRGDEGVQGRLMAWEMARGVTETEPTGVGWKEFVAYIPWQEGRQFMVIRKATHSSYVQVGADLGKYGLFIFLAGIWCGVHTLIAVKPRDEVQERCRRAAFLVLAGYVLSSWMINREYHTEYFLLIAVAAAMHRLKKGEELAARSTEPAAADVPSAWPAATPGLVEAAFVKESPDAEPEPVRRPTPAFSSAAGKAGATLVRPLWNRFGLIDVGVSAGLTWLTFWTWDYLLVNL